MSNKLHFFKVPQTSTIELVIKSQETKIDRLRLTFDLTINVTPRAVTFDHIQNGLFQNIAHPSTLIKVNLSKCQFSKLLPKPIKIIRMT